MQWFNNINFKFIENRKIAYLISITVIAIGLIFILFIRKGLNLGIDFKGGYKARIKFENELSIKDIELIRKQLQVELKTIGLRRDTVIIEKILPALASEYAMQTLKKRDEVHLFKSTEDAFNLIGLEKEYLNSFTTIFTTEEGTKTETGEDSIITSEKIERNKKINLNKANLKELEIGYLEVIPSGFSENINNKLTRLFKDKNKFEFESSSLIGAKVGSRFTNTAIITLLIALAGMLIYIALRFELKFAVGATLALIHDMLVTVGFLSILDRSFSLPIIAALLTIVGYSINDTIVIFDRIREKLKYKTKETYNQALNNAVNATLSRTVLTSLTTFIVVFALFLFGGEAINDFALTLMIGIITGTYSSIFVATPLLVEWRKLFE